MMVQRALSWAIRAWTPVDPKRAADLLRDETGQAIRAVEGARAWVVRDALSQQPVELAAALRGQMAGIRRDRRAPSTSIAAARSAHFAVAFLGAHDAVAGQGDRTTRSRA
jgi:hypothetical protein